MAHDTRALPLPEPRTEPTPTGNPGQSKNRPCFAIGAKDYTTPNIDRLTAEGRKFTSFHVAQAVCSTLPPALQNANPTGAMRLLDGTLTRDAL